MRLDNEPLSDHSAVLSKHGSPQFRYMKRNIDFIEQEIAKNLKGGFANLQNIKNNATTLASEINDKDEFLNTPELDCTMIVEDMSLGTENIIRDSVGSCKVPSRKLNRSGKTETQTCSAKITMPSELPELLVCYKGDTNAVKDICVDEEVFVKDKISIKVPSDGTNFSVMKKESDNDEFLSPDGSLQLSESDYDNDCQEIKRSSESIFACDNTSVEVNYSPTNKNVADASHGKALSPDFGSQKTLRSFLLSSDYNGNEFDQPTNKVPCSEVTNGVPANGLAYNSKLDCTKSVSEFSSSKLAYNGDDEVQQGHGDSSSGRITCSGPMLIYSGSVSIRSDSSSTRSFAFPILQPEWHASPVKMAKPDRRRYRKHGGWKQALTCCRF